MDILYTAIKFIVAGIIIVGVTLLAQHADPRYGGLLAAAPITTTLAFLFTYSEAGRQVTRELVLASFWFVIPTAIFLFVLYFLMDRFGILPSLGGAYTVWAAAVLVMFRILPSGA
ncbi:MAG TPA: GlpM family protein [Methanoregulaceae archaeon]|nr:GlpM family protein [Methanoregulaceae archaeon]HRY75002.1 GlpM family protein [Methanoregulaceae archaeon]